VKTVVLAALRFYKSAVSPMLPPACRYTPTCSEYAMAAVERFGVATMPTLVVVQDKVVQARLEKPRGCREIESFLAPWLK